MSQILNDLLNQLKEITNHPDLYLDDYFNNLKNTVDLSAENLLLKISQTNENPNEYHINNQRLSIIKRIDLFKKECLNALNKRDQSVSAYSKLTIPNIEKRIEIYERNLKLGFHNNDISNDIRKEIYKFKKDIFMNKTIIFDESTAGITSFGRLILIHGIYLNENDQKLIM